MILSINTSTGTFSAALCDDRGNCVKETSVGPADGKRVNHSEIILKRINSLLSVSGTGVKKVACTLGPGSFTGIRIGLTFARCLCQYYGLPFTGLKTDSAFVQRVKIHSRENGEKPADVYCTLIPASMNEIYVSLFTGCKPHACPKEIFPCKVINLSDLKKYIYTLKTFRKKLNIVFTGDWAAANRSFLANAGVKDSEIVETDSMPSLARATASLAPRLPSLHFSKALPFYIQPPRLR